MLTDQDLRLERKSPAIDFRGFWEDEKGSVLDLAVAGNALSGMLRVRGERRSFSLSGVVHGDLLSFFVNDPSGDLLGFAGQYESSLGAEVISMVWISNGNATSRQGASASIRSGSSSFRRV